MVLAKHQSPNQRPKTFLPLNDSPSRQLLHDLEHAFEQLVMHDHECKKVHAYQRRQQQEELDARDLARAKLHMAALEAASARHEAVRQEAEAVLQRHIQEQEQERQRREAEERARQEQEAREKAEAARLAQEAAERKAREEKQRREAEAERALKMAAARALSAQVEAEKKERETKAQQERDEKARLEKQQAEREAEEKAQAAKLAAERERAQQKQQQSQSLPDKVRILTTGTSDSSRPGFWSESVEMEAQHNEYLALHQKLKVFRRDFWEQAKADKATKAIIGQMRRDMKTSVGQLTDDKTTNRKAQERVKMNLQKALSEVPSPNVPINDYLPPHLQIADGSTSVPGLLVYLLSVFSKAVFAAFTREAAVNPRAAEPIGTLVAQIFSMDSLSIPRPARADASSDEARGSLIPILICKFHATAALLFGVSGSEATVEGRKRLGWRAEAADGVKKTFVSEQRHHERLSGLGAGWAAIALRNFSRTKLHNPFPPKHYWASLAMLLNTPARSIQTSHLVILRAMLDNSAIDRFVLFFGNAAIALLRDALIDMPKRLDDQLGRSAEAKSIGLMVEQLADYKHMRLLTA